MANLSRVDLDPKGYAVLAGGKGHALVFRGEKAVEPFVIASGYDPDTGQWSSGSYFADLGHAWECFQDDILEEASVRWVDEDFERALEQAGAPVNEDTMQELLDACENLRHWRDRAVSMGNDLLDECAADIARSIPRKAVNIDWDIASTVARACAPLEMRIPDRLCGKDEISDWLTEVTGYWAAGFDIVEADEGEGES